MGCWNANITSFFKEITELKQQQQKVRIGNNSSYFNSSEESGTNNSGNILQDGKELSKAKEAEVLREPAREDALSGLWLVNREDLMSGEQPHCLARATTSSSADRRKSASKTSHLDMRRAVSRHQEGCC